MAGWTSAALVLAGILTAWMEPGLENLLHAGGLLAGCWAAVWSWRRGSAKGVHWAVLLPAGCAAWALMQLAWGQSVYRFETWNAATEWLARAAVFATACAAFGHGGDRERLKKIAVYFGGVYSLLTLVEWYTGAGTIFWLFPTQYENDVAGTFGNRDQYAALMELLLPLAMMRVYGGARDGGLSAAAAGFMFASVVASGSRGGALMVTAEVLVFTGAASFGRRRNLRAAGLVAACVAGCTLAGGWTYVWERFKAPDPFAYRREILAGTVEMIRARPVAGFGLGTWPVVYPAYAVFDPPGVYMNHAHNDWAEWAAEGGIPVVMLMAGFAGAIGWRARKRLWAMGIPAVFLHSIVDFPFQKPAIALAVMLLAGASVAEPRGDAEIE